MKKCKIRAFTTSNTVAILLSTALIILLGSCDNNTTKLNPVIGISLNQATLYISVGDKSTLTAIITPENATNQNVSWTSSDSSIATVSDTGVVMGITQGSATIIVTTQDGGFTYSCQVTVINKIDIGDIIQFGSYNWIVLDIQGDQALIISENIIELRAYHPSWNNNITWAECSLRAYLNGDFYNSSAFSNEDRSRIVWVTNINLDNQWYGISGGVNTQDRIFILSIAEVVQYFGDSGRLENKPTWALAISDQYNSNRIATFNGTASNWWLRSPGYNPYDASRVRSGGEIGMDGLRVGVSNGVRPALWLNIIML